MICQDAIQWHRRIRVSRSSYTELQNKPAFCFYILFHYMMALNKWLPPMKWNCEIVFSACSLWEVSCCNQRSYSRHMSKLLTWDELAWTMTQGSRGTYHYLRVTSMSRGSICECQQAKRWRQEHHKPLPPLHVSSLLGNTFLSGLWKLLLSRNNLGCFSNASDWNQGQDIITFLHGLKKALPWM